MLYTKEGIFCENISTILLYSSLIYFLRKINACSSVSSIVSFQASSLAAFATLLEKSADPDPRPVAFEEAGVDIHLRSTDWPEIAELGRAYNSPSYLS